MPETREIYTLASVGLLFSRTPPKPTELITVHPGPADADGIPHGLTLFTRSNIDGTWYRSPPALSREHGVRPLDAP